MEMNKQIYSPNNDNLKSVSLLPSVMSNNNIDLMNSVFYNSVGYTNKDK